MTETDSLATRMHRLMEEDEELFFHIYDQGKAARETDGEKFAALITGLSVVVFEVVLYAVYHFLVWGWRML